MQKKKKKCKNDNFYSSYKLDYFLERTINFLEFSLDLTAEWPLVNQWIVVIFFVQIRKMKYNLLIWSFGGAVPGFYYTFYHSILHAKPS